jgi:hypothetical protein
MAVAIAERYRSLPEATLPGDDDQMYFIEYAHG